MQKGFKRSENEATLYVKKSRNKVQLILSLYVDDLLVIGNNSNSLKQFKHDMENEFEKTNLGKMNYLLGVEIYQLDVGILLSQRKSTFKDTKEVSYREM